MTTGSDIAAPGGWKKKAVAFVTRAHRHLWGKNNEDPLAYLFKCGLTNDFAKRMMLGWNKFGQNRPGKNWGLEGNLFLPPGITVPYIIDQDLVSVFIHSYVEKAGETTDRTGILIPGSRTPTMILGNRFDRVIIIRDLLDGLYLHQESREAVGIVVHPDTGLAPSQPALEMVRNAREAVLCMQASSPGENQLRSRFKDAGRIKICKYEKQGDLVGLFSG